MGSFWALSDGESAAETTTKDFDGGGGNMAPIPEGSSVLAMPDSTNWAEDRNGNEYLSIRWTVLKPDEYLNRKIFQKLWITDDDPRAKDPAKKRDKALRMFAAIDANAGGKLAKKDGKPSDDDLSLALVNKQMVLRLGVWDMEGDDGKSMTGNWVQAISSKDKPVSSAPEQPKRQAQKAAQRPAFDTDLDDDVPF